MSVEQAKTIIEIIAIVLTPIVSILGILSTSRATRDKITHQLTINQNVTNNEINHLKDEMAEMKDDIKSHNHYAKIFSESLPEIRAEIKVVNQRLDDHINFQHDNND